MYDTDVVIETIVAYNICLQTTWDALVTGTIYWSKHFQDYF